MTAARACGPRDVEGDPRDERVLLPVAAYRKARDVTIALPTVVGRHGAVNELEPSVSDKEPRALEQSAATLRDAARSVGVPSGTADRA
jgi:malate/lactate dehydrogenase